MKRRCCGHVCGYGLGDGQNTVQVVLILVVVVVMIVVVGIEGGGCSWGGSRPGGGRCGGGGWPPWWLAVMVVGRRSGWLSWWLVVMVVGHRSVGFCNDWLCILLFCFLVALWVGLPPPPPQTCISFFIFSLLFDDGYTKQKWRTFYWSFELKKKTGRSRSRSRR